MILLADNNVTPCVVMYCGKLYKQKAEFHSSIFKLDYSGRKYGLQVRPQVFAGGLTCKGGVGLVSL